MNKNDDFDKFLKNRIQKAKYNVKDSGFTEKVISNLPDVRDYSIKRNYVLYAFSILSVIIFFISTGFKSLIMSIIDLLYDFVHLTKPSFISFIVILAFLSIVAFIASFEYNRSTI